ncbi:MAG TPA: HIT family protein [Actinomycetota bacterium]|nr:HIT family protein [Actinomycetota bacterium]
MSQEPADCIFCDIINGDAPSTTIYSDDLVVSFMDIFPWGKGHCLVVPKEHAVTIFELSLEGAEAVMRAVHKIAPALKKALEPDGLNLFQANGRAAWQSVDHFHMHLVPRWENDGLRPPGTPTPADGAALSDIGEKIKSALG